MKSRLQLAKRNESACRRKHPPKIRRCNLCGSDFHPRTVFDRFCNTCKEQSELLRFSEWLPDVNEMLMERLSA